MRLDAFAERFAQAGIAALAFTYRHFGDSGGQPRQLLSIKRQLADWDAAIAWVKNRRDVDGTRIAVWGSSFGGGHSITVASRPSRAEGGGGPMPVHRRAWPPRSRWARWIAEGTAPSSRGTSLPWSCARPPR